MLRYSEENKALKRFSPFVIFLFCLILLGKSARTWCGVSVKHLVPTVYFGSFGSSGA